MAELQFKVDSTALQTIQSTKLTANFKEMETALTEFIAPYESLIVTEDGVSMAKSDRAKLRSIANNIDAHRKQIKAIYSSPLKEFEENCKRLNAIIDRGVKNLDSQVKEFEQKRREEKLFLLDDYFTNQKETMKYPDYISWEDVLNEKWGNATYPVETAHTEIDNACLNVDRDVQQIIDSGSEFQITLLDNYKRTHDYFGTMSLKERLEAQKKAEEEKQKRLEQEYIEERKRAAERAAASEDLVAEEEEPAEEVQKPKPEMPMYAATYTVYATAKELEALQGFFNTMRVKYKLMKVDPVD